MRRSARDTLALNLDKKTFLFSTFADPVPVDARALNSSVKTVHWLLAPDLLHHDRPSPTPTARPTSATPTSGSRQDVIARFKRLDGYDVLSLSGMDEHGQKMQQTAAREGLTPQGLADRTAGQFLAMNRLLGTESRRRHPHDRGAPPRRRPGDLAPHGGNGATSTCRATPAGIRCATRPSHDEADLVPGRTARALAPTGTPVEWVEEESWFFRLSAYGDRLLAHYAAHPGLRHPREIPQRGGELRGAGA